MIKDYYRINNSFVQIPHIEIDTFKNLMGFKNISNYDLKKFVLEKIIVDINKNTNFNFTYKFLNKIGSKKPTHIELKFSKEKSIIPKIENKKSDAESLKEIKKERELSMLENIQIAAEKRYTSIKKEIYYEDAIKRYKSVIRELDKKIDEFRFISEDEENEEY